MRYPASEKAEIIQLVEQSDQTGEEDVIGIPYGSVRL
jgi:hypothetical protein